MTKKKELRTRLLSASVRSLLSPSSEHDFQRAFFRWVSEQRLTDARQVRELPKILVNQQTVKALDTKGFEAAMDVLRHDDPALSSDLFAAVKNSTERLREAPMSDIQDLAANPAKLIMLRNLHRALEDLGTLAVVKL
jgi:hypothetical protein